MFDEQPELREALSGVIAGWHPPGGPDFRHLLDRSAQTWRPTVGRMFTLASTVLATLLVLGVLVLMLGSLLPEGDQLRSHLIGHP